MNNIFVTGVKVIEMRLRCILIIVCLSLVTCRVQGEKDSFSLTATTQAEERLTRLHGAEIEQIIEDYLLRRNSLATNTDPRMLAELETGPWLELSQRLYRNGEGGQSLLVSRIARVERIRILEYDSDRFEAFACVTRATDKLTIEGNLIESYPARLQCGVYVFLREDGIWKHAGYFDTTDLANISRNWAIESKWLKDIIGKLPDEATLRELSSPN